MNLPVSPEMAIAFINAATTPESRHARRQLVQDLLNGSVTAWDGRRLVLLKEKGGIDHGTTKHTKEDSKP